MITHVAVSTFAGNRDSFTLIYCLKAMAVTRAATASTEAFGEGRTGCQQSITHGGESELVPGSVNQNTVCLPMASFFSPLLVSDIISFPSESFSIQEQEKLMLTPFIMLYFHF